MGKAYAIGMAVTVALMFVASLLFSVNYTRSVQQDSDRQWCELLISLDVPPPPNAPARTRRIQAQIHKLRVSKGCETTP